jgi:drug/metabolite transporter (DMT)-like permease
MTRKPLPKKTYVLLALMIALGSLGDTLLSKGMKQFGEIQISSAAQLFSDFFHALWSGTIWLGILCLVGFFICYILVLSWADLSYVLPASAMSYVVVPLLGALWLREVVGPVRWAGIGFICLGVIVVGSTSHNTTSAPVLSPKRREEQS